MLEWHADAQKRTDLACPHSRLPACLCVPVPGCFAFVRSYVQVCSVVYHHGACVQVWPFGGLEAGAAHQVLAAMYVGSNELAAPAICKGFVGGLSSSQFDYIFGIGAIDRGQQPTRMQGQNHPIPSFERGARVFSTVKTFSILELVDPIPLRMLSAYHFQHPLNL